MNEQFESWLYGGEPHTTISIGDGCITLFRLPACDGLEAIYSRCAYRAQRTPLRENFEYGGVYDRRRGVLYDAQYDVRTKCGGREDDDAPSKSDLAMAAERNIREIVDAMLRNDRAALNIQSEAQIADKRAPENLAYFREHEAAQEARRLFLEGKTPGDVVVACHYRGSGMSDEDFLDYLADAGAYCERKAAEYFDANQENFFMKFLENDAVKAELAAIYANPAHDAHTVRAIIEAAKKRDCVTVSVTTRIDGKYLTFKTQASDLHQDGQSGYSDYRMDADGRRDFKETYGNLGKYFPKDIVKITYGRAVLYEKEK
jgi:hypothetical protein